MQNAATIIGFGKYLFKKKKKNVALFNPVGNRMETVSHWICHCLGEKMSDSLLNGIEVIKKRLSSFCSTSQRLFSKVTKGT